MLDKGMVEMRKGDILTDELNPSDVQTDEP
jgi:hypothetical protein